MSIQQNDNVDDDDSRALAADEDAAAMPPPADDDHDASPGNGEGSDDEEEGVYETSYSKLAAATGGRGIPPSSVGIGNNNKKSRRRRGGYGNPTSVLEALTTTSKSTNPEGDMEDSNNDARLSKTNNEFAMDVDDFAAEGISESNIFIQTQDDDEEDDGGSDASDNDDDAEMNDAEGDDANDAESEDERPRGRTKRSGKRKEANTDKEADGAKSEEEEEEEVEFPQSEASGYGFSLGESPAPPQIGSGVAETMEGGESDGERTPAEKVADAEEEEEGGEREDPGPEESPADEPASEPSGEPVDDAAGPPTASERAGSDEEPSSAPEPVADPSDAELCRLVDALFRDADKDTMTVGGINSSVASHYGWAKVEKKRRKRIKARLTDLINGKVETAVDEEAEAEDSNNDKMSKKSNKKKKKSKKGKKNKKHRKKEAGPDPRSDAEEEEEEEEEPFEGDYESEEADDNGNDSSSDYDDARPKKSKSKKKSRKSKPREGGSDDDADSDEDSVDSEERSNSRRKRSSRSKPNRGKGRMAKHIRDRHEKARLRQLEEARIRTEELGHLADDGDEKSPQEAPNDEDAPRLSVQDRERANLIAERFDTNSEELITKRREERVGLIERLRQKRLESLGGGLTSGETGAEAKRESAKEEGYANDANNANKEGTEGTNEDLVEAKPELASTVEAAGGEEVLKINKPMGAGAMVDLDDDDDSSDDESDDDSEDDLEIIPSGSSKESAPSTKKDAGGIGKATALSKASSSKTGKKASVMDMLFNPGTTKSAMAPQRKKKLADPRMAIRNALRLKQIQASNRWLANELGFKGSTAGQDHIRECKEKENEKRMETLRLEKAESERLAKLEKEAALRGEFYEVVDEAGEDEDDGDEDYDEEEDEMAMARKMDLLEPTGADGDDGDNGEGDENSDELADGIVKPEDPQQPETEKLEEKQSNGDTDVSDHGKPADGNATPVLSSPGKIPTGSIVTPLRDQVEAAARSTNPEDENLEMITDHGSADPFANHDNAAEEADSKKIESENKSSKNKTDDNNPGSQPLQDEISDTNSSKEASSPNKQDSEPSRPKKPKNSAWQAMLQKEKEKFAKQKKLQKRGGNTLVDGEAEEEEEEDGIVGLEDFGFAVQPKKGDDDEVDADVHQDDLDHVVDEVSDGEGDEEAGTDARKRLERAEEKARHKDMVRRMKEGYDGRRGGIASGVGGARGTIRFDQLVAAGNKEDAKRLGLLNDDELDSDDEEGEGPKDKNKGYDEEEDEAALLDKWMKERVLTKGDDNIEENFTDDEDSDDEADIAEKTNDDDDDEEREQDRLAKHFAKRARRNRMLEQYEGDSQFSRSRLIDEDVSTQQDLKIMKTSFFRKRSSTPLLGDSHDSKENNCSSKKPKGPSSHGSDGTSKETTSSFLAHEGSLSVALMASRRTTGSRKRKTTFLSGRQKGGSSFSRNHSTSASSSKTVSLNHVVFMAGDSQSATSQLPDSSSNSFLMNTVKSRRGHSKNSCSKKASRGGSSLWSKVCSKNFKAN